MIKHSVLRLNGESEVRSDLPHSQWHSDSDGGFHVALINLQHELDNRLIFPFLSIIKISSVRIGGISWFRNEYDEWWNTHTHQNHRIRWFFFYPRPVSLSYSLPLVLSSKKNTDYYRRFYELRSWKKGMPKHFIWCVQPIIPTSRHSPILIRESD